MSIRRAKDVCPNVGFLGYARLAIVNSSTLEHNKTMLDNLHRLFWPTVDARDSTLEFCVTSHRATLFPLPVSARALTAFVQVYVDEASKVELPRGWLVGRPQEREREKERRWNKMKRHAIPAGSRVVHRERHSALSVLRFLDAQLFRKARGCQWIYQVLARVKKTLNESWLWENNFTRSFFHVIERKV